MIQISFRHASRLTVASAVALAGVIFQTGCGPGDIHSNASDRFGRTYYIDGAGNWGFGVSEVYQGLRRAGYKGNIINHRWSPTLNPALDQTIGRFAARGSGEALGRQIGSYLKDYPENDVNIIALSAGTGVAVWACESVTAPYKVNNLVLLGSSLSSTYDMRKALGNIKGGVWVYHSPNDMILQGPVRTLGTIDGQLGVEPAGIVGLRASGGDGGKIHNRRWSRSYERWGWSGAHTDATSEPFVYHEISKHIVRAGPPTTSTAMSSPKTASDRSGVQQAPNSAAGAVSQASAPPRRIALSATSRPAAGPAPASQPASARGATTSPARVALSQGLRRR